MTIADVLPVILYILGAILLALLIVLTVKLILTMNKIEKVVDNILLKEVLGKLEKRERQI